MPYNPKTNRWEGTTKALNRERRVEKSALKMSDEELLASATGMYGAAVSRGEMPRRPKRARSRRIKAGTTGNYTGPTPTPHKG